MGQPAFDGIYKNKKVLITGNTGFKGSWLTFWLSRLGATVYGYSLRPPSEPSMFERLQLDDVARQTDADIMDLDLLTKSISKIQPDIIFHLAAQSLVRESYESPLETVRVNTMGSVHLMEAVRRSGIATVLIMVTSDKCYMNKEWIHGYRETDPLGGYDPYSSSKGAAEILIDSWRRSYFDPAHIAKHGVRLASVRAGNVIGGGDWAKDRIVPDCIRDLTNTGVIGVRNPRATRPWQHVLEPLHGYLHLGAILLEVPAIEAAPYCEAFNFGPHIQSNRSVESLVDKIIYYWGSDTRVLSVPPIQRHEASLLNLSIDKSYHRLNWLPRWNFNTTVRYTVQWYLEWKRSSSDLSAFTDSQINAYEESLQLQSELQLQYT